MSKAGAGDAAAAFCAELVRSADFDRYASTLFVDAGSRRALLALYAFNAEIVRVRDQISQPLPGEVRLQWWIDMLAGNAHGGVEGNPVAAELMRAIAAYYLPAGTLSGLVEAHIFDLYNDPMPDMAALDAYAAATDGALFTLAARILSHGSEAIDHLARHAGMAQVIARIIARLPYDASRRQLYVPNDLLQRHRCDVERVFSGQPTPELRSALAEFVGEGRKHFDQAMTLLAEVPREMRPAFLPLALVRRDLDRLYNAERDPFTPFERSRLATLWTLWRAARSRAFR
jgi:15-cis-phytoene synthase